MRGLFLPLKFTQSIDIVNSFTTHITKKHNKDAATSARPTFEDMQNLRNKLDFGKMQAQINNDYRLAVEFQVQIANYIRYIYLVDTFFKNDFPESRYLKLNFPWTDSFQPTKKAKAINHIKYELASCLYNLAICYYLEGIHYIAVPGAPEKLKGIAKLRNAIWCINELKQVLPSLLVNPADLPSDLNPSYINLLLNYFIGLTYAALVGVMNLDTKKNGPEKLASVNKAAAKYFQIAYDIIASFKQSPIPEPQAKNLKMNLLYNAVMFRSEAYYNMALIHLKNVDDEILKGHMGYAVSYLRIPKTDLDELFKRKADLEVLTQDQRVELVDRARLITKNYDDCYLKNQKVYRQTEYRADQLPEIPEEKAQITPIEPKDIKKKLDQEGSFQVFLSPEIIALKNEFLNFVSVKMLETENNLKNINNVKNKLYSEASVNYVLDLESQTANKKFDIPPQLKAKIEKFKKNGGVNSYMYTRKNIGELSSGCETILNEVKGQLAAEKNDDETLRRQFPSQWNRAYSEQVGQEYVFKMRDLEQKFYIAKSTDVDINKKFDHYQEWMQKFSLPDEQILAFIPKSADADFTTQNKQKLSELIQLNGKILQLIDLETERARLIALTENFLKVDFVPSFVSINNKQVDKQVEFENAIAPYKAQLAEIETHINEAYPLLEAISSQAKEMNSTRSQSNQTAMKILEEMSLAVTVLNEIFDDFQQGLAFYSNLNFHLNSLQKVAGDFCLAREIEKNALLQELQAQKSYDQNFNAPKPYYPETMPQNSQPTYIQGYPQQTQAFNNQAYQNPVPQHPQSHVQPQPQHQSHPQSHPQPQPQQNYGNQQNQQFVNPFANTYQNQNQNKPVAQSGYMALGSLDGGDTGLGQFGNMIESTIVKGSDLRNQGINPNAISGRGPGPY